jgi:YD repeat-containing protein
VYSRNVEVLTTQTKYITKIENGITVNTGLPYLTGTTTGSDTTLQWHSISLTVYTEQNQVLRSISIDMNNTDALALVFNEDGTLKSYSQLTAVTTWTGCSVTSYDYDSSLSGSPDQVYSVASTGSPAQYSWYDSDNRQVVSWTYWDDPSTTASLDKRILNVNEFDAQGRTTRTVQIIDDNVNDQNPQISTILNSIQSLVDNGTARVLIEMQYNSIGKVDYSLNCTGRTELTEGFELAGDITLYSYDQTGNTTQTISGSYTKTCQTGNPIPTAFNYTQKTESRTLYDAEGRAVVSVGPYDPAVAGKDRVGTETVYDNLGRVERTRRWANVAITLQDIVVNSVVVGKEAVGCTSNGAAMVAGNELSYSRTEYDSAGRVDKSYSLNELRDEICGSQYRYDIAGRQVKTITLPDDTTGKRSETTTQYDGSRRQSVTDGLGETTTFEYDEQGRVTTTIHPASRVNDVDENSDGNFEDDITYTHVGYDGMGRKYWEAVQTTHANTDEDPVPDSEMTYYEYDIAGRLISVTMPAVANPENSNELTNPLYNYYYDSNGDQVCILDDKGCATLFEYDCMHRLSKKYQPYLTNFTPSAPSATRPVFSDGDAILDNDILSQKPANQVFEQKWYDDYGRLWKEKSYAGKYTVYTYNALGQLEYERYYTIYLSSYPLRFVMPEIQTEYDNLGRKRYVTMWERNSIGNVVAGTEQQWEYQYDDKGNLAKIISPQGAVNYDYSDITGRKISTYTGADPVTAQDK